MMYYPQCNKLTMTHRNWFVAQEVEVLIIPKQVLPWLWGLKPLPTHDEVSPKIAPCLNTKACCQLSPSGPKAKMSPDSPE